MSAGPRLEFVGTMRRETSVQVGAREIEIEIERERRKKEREKKNLSKYRFITCVSEL